MRIRFVDEANLEFLDTVSYYKKQRPDLGQRFKTEVDQSIRWLAEHVQALTKVDLMKLEPAAFGLSSILNHSQVQFFQLLLIDFTRRIDHQVSC